MQGNPGTLLSSLLADPTRVAELAPDQAVATLTELFALMVMVAAKLAAAAVKAPEAPSAKGGEVRYLTVSEAAQRSHKSARWVRDNWRREMSFGVKKGRTLLFPEPEFEKWMKRS